MVIGPEFADCIQRIRQFGSFIQLRYTVGRISAGERKVRTEKTGIDGAAAVESPQSGSRHIAS